MGLGRHVTATLTNLGSVLVLAKMAMAVDVDVFSTSCWMSGLATALAAMKCGFLNRKKIQCVTIGLPLRENSEVAIKFIQMIYEARPNNGI